MERVVGRSELRSEEVSPASSPEADTLHTFQALDGFDFFQATEANVSNGLHEEDESEDGMLDFRLFSETNPLDASQTTEAAQKIRFRSPTVDDGNVGFIEPDRRSTYYFAKPLSELERENLQASALSGDQVLALSKTPRPGSAYPWKVLTVSASTKDKSSGFSRTENFQKLVDQDKATKRARPGKKYRIRLRIKHAALKERQNVAKAVADASKAAEQEKRTRRNREKKVKKKLREKAKKAGGSNEAEDAEADADDMSDS